MNMRIILLIATVLALSACTSFKAGQFGACIVTGTASCEVKNNQAGKEAEVKK